ncbi:DNA-directed RNA polymerase III subunit RPC4 [Amphibalanus amphitrite]|uniref:DNA-directed RNA polymerase III subunit RPC4 n=1 Tax=Amphibalanus amphitrite TaxID=1232801 RepID=A0A6A4VBA4_AMPAM|nr:DNA-directed RNA polymerase III subunit RPC4 [Amphibalanus amphitrite]
MLKEGRKDLVFFQFPDCLPVLTSNDDDVKLKPKKEPSASSAGTTNGVQADTKAPNPELVTFSDLPEGQVGRLQILKSGRARLLLGDHVLELDAGTQVKFLQEAASVSTSADGSSGSVSVLGHIRHRVVASPAWDTLIHRDANR